MAKLTISVPQDLADRLREYRRQVVVSAVCQEALSRELERLALKEECNVMALSERLGAALDLQRPEVTEAGRQRGLRWATEDGDLETLTLIKSGLGNSSAWREVEEILLDAGIRDEFEDEGHLDVLWCHFANGFCEGAIEALDEALEQVRRSG